MRPLVVAAVLAAALPWVRPWRRARGARCLASAFGQGGLCTGVFELVGLHWQGPGVVEYRTREPRRPLERVAGVLDRGCASGQRPRAPGEPRLARREPPSGRAPRTRIQYRTVGRVARMRALLRAQPEAARCGPRAPHLAGAPAIITRSGWHADESIRRGAPFYADAVHLAIVHHTAGSNSYTKAQSASIVEAIELYHVKGNGWNDIGYNFLVDKYGQIFEGRYGGMTRAVIGAHAQGFNTGSVGIAVIGDFSSTWITPAARAAPRLVDLLASRPRCTSTRSRSVVRVSAGNPRYASGRAVTLRAVSGHRDVYPTSCPGQSLYAQLPSIRDAVAQSGLPSSTRRQ